MKKIFGALFATLLLAIPSVTRAQYITITNADNTLTITSYTNTNGIVIIPSNIGGRTVVAVDNDGSAVFPETVTNVVIPNSVTSIGEYAFDECYYLTNVTVPDSVTNIGAGAFYSCSNLSGVNIPNGVTRIADYTFYLCERLTNITFPPSVSTIQNEAFEYCYGLGNVVIPPTVTEIGEYAFYEAYMTNLTIGTNSFNTNGSCQIDYGAFYYCEVASNVFIGSSVGYIGYYAFYESEMANLAIGQNLSSFSGPGCTIDYYAFYDCYYLNNLTIGDTVTAIGEDAFYYTYATNVVIGTNLSNFGPRCSIGEDAFEDMHYATNLTIGNTVGSIGYYAFGSCGASNVTIGDNTLFTNGGGCSIGYEAFYESEMTNLYVGRSVSAIQEDAFESCYYASNIYVGGGSIGYEAFYECEYAQNLYLGNDVTSIGNGAFEYCYDLTNAYIGGGAIGYEAFYECDGLTNVIFGPNVTTIGYYAFYDCSFPNLVIPDNVSAIGDYAFYYCYNLTNAVLGQGIKSLGYYAFEDCYQLKTVTFGPNFGSIGYYAFYECTNLHALYFQGNGPTSDSSGFYDDTNITAYYFSGTTGWGTNFYGFPTVQVAANSLTVTFGPVSAVADGAYWQLDGAGSYTAAVTTLNNLAPGSHTVSFVPIAGWTTPASRTVTVTNDVSVSGFYIPTTTPGSGLVILTNGSGAVTVTGSPKTYVAGKSYKITAVPAPGNLFVSWEGGTSQPFAVLSTAPAYTFVFEPNLVLVATFVTNPFVAVSGTYNGLFTTTEGVTEATAGMLSGLTISTKGSYSGKLLINNSSFSISGSFDTSGNASNNIARKAAAGGPLTLLMTLSTDGITSVINGTVLGTGFTANLIAEEANNQLPSTEYTMLIQPDTNNTPPTNSPGGDGYILITNIAGTAKNPGAAAAKLTAGLADGTTFSQTVAVSSEGYVPIYASLSGKGLILGWINLNGNDALSTGLTWIHNKAAKGLYTAGFTNRLTGDQLPISPWDASVLPLLTNLTVVDAIGDTNGSSTTIAVSTAGKVTGAQASGTIDPKTGLMKLILVGGGGNKLSVTGAVLAGSTNGGGYFVTKTDAGGFTVSH
jgi:hypothetical protein